MASPCDLPSQVFKLEILTRTPLETLARCRAVCKEWNLVTYNSSFINIHSSKTRNLSGFLIQNTRGWECNSEFLMPQIDRPSCLSLDFLPNKVRMVEAVDQGIVYCVTQYISRSTTSATMPRYHTKHYAWKPSTKQWRVFPPTLYQSRCSALKVLRSHPLHFKIICFSYDHWSFGKKEEMDCARVQIFDSNTWAWRRAKDVELHHCEMFEPETGIATGNVLHWITRKRRILAYDLEHESWSVFRIRELIDKDARRFLTCKLTNYQGKLAILCDNNDNFTELWIRRGEEWIKERTWKVDKNDSSTVLGFYSSEVALVADHYNSVFLHNLDKGTSDVIKFQKAVDKKQVFLFQSDKKFTELLEERGSSSVQNEELPGNEEI